jgi:hypothetical protein
LENINRQFEIAKNVTAEFNCYSIILLEWTPMCDRPLSDFSDNTL